jgi:catechol 2,3-dioxygenase-like lactoylglutathione lyase family enzyme
VFIDTQTPEGTMSTTEQSTTTATPVPAKKPADLKLEVVVLSVADADRAKRFYASLGWREDADFPISEGFRVLQFTPPGSQASIIFGTGVTPAAPGSGGSLLLTVDDIEASRAELIERGVDVSDVFHGRGFSDAGQGRVPGRAPDGESYGSFATFSDPDGNEFLLQEVTTRLPGRVEEPDVAELAQLLLETALGHGRFEAVAPEHNWWDWYAAYFNARQHGSTAEQATAAADLYMKEVHGVVPR